MPHSDQPTLPKLDAHSDQIIPSELDSHSDQIILAELDARSDQADTPIRSNGEVVAESDWQAWHADPGDSPETV